ncbi:MAG: hypothetical protein EOO47_09725 [Flavobacterium sp.]|nr:MAG: hypothetical protein EOO47_09725 [Flavobacterium sp.]
MEKLNKTSVKNHAFLRDGLLFILILQCEQGIYFTKDSFHKKVGINEDFDLFIKSYLLKKIKKEKLSISSLARETQFSRATIYRNMVTFEVLYSALSWLIKNGYVKAWGVSNAALKITLVNFTLQNILIRCNLYKDTRYGLGVLTIRSPEYFANFSNQLYMYTTNANYSELKLEFSIPITFEELQFKLIPLRSLSIAFKSVSNADY